MSNDMVQECAERGRIYGSMLALLDRVVDSDIAYARILIEVERDILSREEYASIDAEDIFIDSALVAWEK